MDEILTRWSPRAFEPIDIPDEHLFAMVDAARWAPSSYNGQPWRFIYGKRGTPAWDKLFGLLVEFNQSWTKNASALILFASKKTFDNGKSAPTHAFDTGAAWQNFALEAQHQGYHAHGMSGFDFEKARSELNIPDDYEVMAMAAVGKKADPSILPENLQEMDKNMSGRKPVKELVFEGSM